ncbi:hypothetical protein ABBQ38_002552 [Trebouxia sp. C0009 RCD-2024]
MTYPPRSTQLPSLTGHALEVFSEVWYGKQSDVVEDQDKVNPAFTMLGRIAGHFLLANKIGLVQCCRYDRAPVACISSGVSSQLAQEACSVPEPSCAGNSDVKHDELMFISVRSRQSLIGLSGMRTI